jgi:hypothetical protein
MEIELIKDQAIKFCSTLAEVYGDDLDRKQMWERIANGLVVASAKCGGDWELFVNEMLKFIKAEPGKVAANKGISNFIETMLVRPQSWKDQFIRECESKHMFICVKARLLWNEIKKKPQESNELGAE